MKEERTTTCSEHNHPEFALSFDEELVLEEDVAWLLSSLQDLVAGGQTFTPGDSFQIGWLPTLIQERDDGLLTIHEPDMKSIPVAHLPTVTFALLHIRWQKEVADSFDLDPDLQYPSARQSVLICDRLGQQPGFAMHRRAALPPNSGWIICCSDDTHDHKTEPLKAVSLYELVIGINAKSLPFLALPEESQVLIEDQSICLNVEGLSQSLQKDSFLKSVGYLDSM
ncbi:MAG: hypothetical protein COB04_06905 [Gammaproteobacteria bacterium]|nr:MAG: hypothetical protein COB04_06905 [Gammaproteobacteria bacterium]